MAEEYKEMPTPFMEVASRTIQKQGEQIVDIQKSVKVIPDLLQELAGANKQLTEIKVAITAGKLSPKQIQELSDRLAETAMLLKQPQENKVIHHHHINKGIAVAAGLFLACCLLCCCWYNTSQKLDQYQANNLKYRYLKLSNSSALQALLSSTDSLYQFQPGFNEEVEQGEDSVLDYVEHIMKRERQRANDLKKLK